MEAAATTHVKVRCLRTLARATQRRRRTCPEQSERKLISRMGSQPHSVMLRFFITVFHMEKPSMNVSCYQPVWTFTKLIQTSVYLFEWYGATILTPKNGHH